MVTAPPSLESTDDVVDFVSENGLGRYKHVTEEDIKDGHVCDCDHDTRFSRQQDTRFCSGEDRAIYLCDGCGGYYGAVIPNWP